jgi:hypothetical protein
MGTGLSASEPYYYDYPVLCVRQDDPADEGDETDEPGDVFDDLSCSEMKEALDSVCLSTLRECFFSCLSPMDLGCYSDCAETHLACVDTLIEVGSPLGVELFESILNCQDENAQACDNEARAADPECWDNCFGGSACEEACQRQWQQEYDDCQAEACASEYAACVD